MKEALREALRNVLMVFAVFGAVALVTEIPALDAGAREVVGGMFKWAAAHRGFAMFGIALVLAALVTAARLDGKEAARA